MNCIIVEDNELAAMALTKCIERSGELTLLSSFKSGEDALIYLKDNTCNIIFLDIEMEGMSGLDLIRNLVLVPFIIIVSSKSEYAAEAFNFDVVDYIVKPITYERFLKAIHKVKKIADNFQTKGSDFFYIKQDNRMIQVFFKDILYIEALADYINIYLPQKRYIILSTMKAMESQLPAKDFMRIHRSFIVRLDKIREIEENTVSVDGKVIPVSRSNKEEFLKKINIS